MQKTVNCKEHSQAQNGGKRELKVHKALIINNFVNFMGFFFVNFVVILPFSLQGQVKQIKQLQNPKSAAAAPKPAPSGVITLKWTEPITGAEPGGAQSPGSLHFEGAVYGSKNHHLPNYFYRLKINNDINNLAITIENPNFVPLTAAETKALSTNSRYVTASINPVYQIVKTPGIYAKSNEQYANISFIPVIKNAQGQFEKLVSFSLSIKQSYLAGSATLTGHKPEPGTFAPSSVLASGDWFKVGVTQDGIYKMSYSYLKRAGVNMATLKPANIRIFSNGPGMLTQNNSAPRLDDLTENAIYVEGNSDTNFKTGDYVLFYGQSPTVWTYNGSVYSHQVNLYADTTYYFVCVNSGVAGKRIGMETAATGAPTNTVNSFDDYGYHELDGTNIQVSGNEWVGEYFDFTTSYTFSFNFPNIILSNSCYVNTDIVQSCGGNNGTAIYSVVCSNGSTSIPIDYSTCAFESTVAFEGSGSFTCTPSNSIVNVTITKQSANVVGWLRYLEVNVRRSLTMTGNEMEFRDSKSFGAGNKSQFNIGASSKIRVWDVTNPQNIDSVSLSAGAGGYSFETSNDSLKQFMAFSGSSFDSATFSGTVPNQNLHGLPQADLVIVSNPLFITQAEQLAAFHRTQDNLAVNVVTTQQVYNEFSSGKQDPVGIRDFMRMFYTRSGDGADYATAPKYLLLFGDGSYDPLNRLANNTNYVLLYESNDSFDPSSYCSDDFYTLLDSDVTTTPDGADYSYDIGVGRLPADNASEAQTMVNKIMSYETPAGQTVSSLSECCQGQQQYTLGNWKNTVCLIAHDGDGGTEDDYDDFEEDMEQMSAYIQSVYPNFNINKIYCDAYQEIQTPGGPRYPEVNTAIDQQMDQGLFVYVYDGHGGPTGLAYQRILDFTDIYSWTNIHTMPVFFNASCQFSEFDDPSQICGGSLSVEIPNGGVIGMIGATRETYENSNVSLCKAWFQYLYTPLPNDSMPRLGDLMSEAKNATGGTTMDNSNVNNLEICLLGDPAVRLAYPKNTVYTTTVTTSPVTTNPDTVKALAKVTVTGYVGDANRNVLSNFNGLLYPTVYDKPDSITTLDNLGLTPSITFGLQNSVLYKGLISVTSGKFSFTFVVPKDILYYYGFGKISYYAQNGGSDATGHDSVMVGGKATNIYNSGKGPSIRLYMNDSNFVYGGLTNQNPSIFAVLFDSNGINTANNSVGHGITAVLDNNTANTYDLTSSYQPALNSYQKGIINYPLSNLSDGTHTVDLRAWNVYDNTSQAATEFNVQTQSNLQLQHVLNYPDPFTTHTEFFFEINEVCNLMDVQIQIFTVSGQLVKNIVTQVRTQSFRSEPIDWDGRDDYGDKIARGVYIYRIRVRTDQGATAQAYQKLVIL